MSEEEPELEEPLLDEEELKQMMGEKGKREDQSAENLKKWKIYCKRRGKKSVQKEYTKDIEEVGSFQTLKDFFRLYTAIKDPSQLDVDTKLMYFLEGCQPIWEEWLDSGCLLINIRYKDQKRDKVGASILNRVWEFLLFSLIGNSLPSYRLKNGPSSKEIRGKQEIIGITLSRRDKISLIELWFRSDHNAAQITRQIQIDILKELSHLNEHERAGIQMGYRRHKDSFTSQSTMKGCYLLKSSMNDSF